MCLQAELTASVGDPLPVRRTHFAETPGKHSFPDTLVSRRPDASSAQRRGQGRSDGATGRAEISGRRATGFYNGKKERVPSDGVCDFTRIGSRCRQGTEHRTADQLASIRDHPAAASESRQHELGLSYAGFTNACLLLRACSHDQSPSKTRGSSGRAASNRYVAMSVPARVAPSR